MSDFPLVSICIPCFNVESYIKYTINDCLNQTYKNIEVIISDNCSTDRTLHIIRGYNDSRIKIYSNSKNEGLLYNFKKVFTYASGKYMTFLGADDGMDLTTIEKSVKILEANGNENITVINTFIQIINSNGHQVLVKKMVPFGGRIPGYWAIRANFLYGTNALGEPNGSVFRRSAYENIPEPKLSNANNWTADIDLKIELLLQGDAYMIAEPLGKFRVSSQSTSKKELKFVHAKLFREYVMRIYKDKRYKLSFFWVITATVNSILLEIARNIFYFLHINKKGSSKYSSFLSL